MPDSPQETQARRYRIEKYLTEGGMGAIYIGKKLGPNGFAKEVVLKQLLPEYTSRPEFRDLFFREAKISATLDHANIVHTFDLVESDQSLFIVMEYVRGADLRTIIRRARQRKRELSSSAAIYIALEILAGLGYAHARRDVTGKSLDIIHRDVSPSNIICSVQGAAKLSDFGIAKASTFSSVFYRVRGKVGYMSPEQARSQPIDHRCDLFSLSVCLYETLSGERLFVGDLNTPADEIYGVPILPVSQKRRGLPAALDQVMARSLAPNVDDRYQSAAELGEALRTVAHRNGMAFSSPELAAHLRDILGGDAEQWLRDEPNVVAAAAPPATAGASELAGPNLVGKEAASIGIVSDIPEDEPARSVLNPKAVSGSKDFDLDSMLNEEATRPGGEDQAAAALASAPQKVQAPAPEGDGRVRAPGTPPPVWTRDSAPFPLATPKPARVAAPLSRPAALRPAARLSAATVGFPAGRPLPRATVRGSAMPPPFAPAVARAAPPPPPPYPAAIGEGSPSGPRPEIEEPTPSRSEAVAVAVAVAPLPQAISFDIEDAVTPVPGPRAVRGAKRDLEGGAGSHRAMPPAAYPGNPPVVEAPLVLTQPQTMDFGGAITALLPEKKGGPPRWLATLLIIASLGGGLGLAHQVTRAQVALATAPLSGEAPDLRPTTIRAAHHEATPSPEAPPAAVREAAAPAAVAAEPPSDEAVVPAGPATARQGGRLTPGRASAATDPGKTHPRRSVAKHRSDKKHRSKPKH